MGHWKWSCRKCGTPHSLHIGWYFDPPHKAFGPFFRSGCEHSVLYGERV